MEVGLGQGPRYHSIGEGRSWGVWHLQTQERWACLQRSQGWGFLTSIRAGHKVISDIPRITGIHVSLDGVKAQEFVTPEAVVAVEPSYGRRAVPNGRPGTFLYGSCREVPEPRVVAFVQSTNKHLVRPDCALPCACTGPQDGPDVVPITWRSQPSRERIEESSHMTKFSSKVYMISSARAVGRVWENFPEKVILKLKSEGVTKQIRVGDGSLKHEANWVSRE